MPELTPEEKYYRSKITSRITFVAALIVIALLLWRQCENKLGANERIQLLQDSLQKAIADTSRIYAIARGYKTQAEDMGLRYAEADADKRLLQKELIVKSDEADRLHIAVAKAKVEKDTIKLLTYIDTLSLSNKLLSLRVRQLITAQQKSDSIQNRRLEISDSLANHWGNSYKGCVQTLEFVAGELPKIKPKGKLYIDGAVKFGAVTGAGGGLSYADNKGNKFSAKAYSTNVGAVYEAGYGRVLSFKRK